MSVPIVVITTTGHLVTTIHLGCESEWGMVGYRLSSMVLKVLELLDRKGKLPGL